MLSTIRRLMRHDGAATAVEYTILAALIGITAIISLQTIGSKVNGVLSNAASAMK